MDLSELFVEHHGPVVRWATSRTGDRSLAEDIVAEVFARMAASEEPIERPVAYLYRAVSNRLASHWRRRAHETAAVGKLAQQLAAAPASSPLLDRLVLGDLLADLSPTQRRVLALRYLEDRDVASVAADLGISSGAVKAYSSRGLARLRRAASHRDELVAA